MSPIQGFTRLRNWQLGKQTVLGTPVPATRRMPYRGNPATDPHWTDPDVDVGSLDPVLPPYRLGLDITAPWQGALTYDDAAVLASAGLKGGVAPGGSASGRTWAFHVSSLSADPFDYYTGEWGDDVVADNFQYFGGVVESLQWTYPQDLGAVQMAAGWRFAGVNYPVAETGGLSVDSDPVYVMHADTEYFVDDAAGGIGASKLTDSVHDATVTVTNNLDVKRFPNGSNTRFQVSGFGRAGRTIVATLNFAKQTATLVEAAHWLNADAVNRFLEIKTTAVRHVAAGATPYSHRLRLAGRWYTRSESEIGGNAGFQLECHAFYNSTLGYPFGLDLTNGLAALP